MKLTKAKIDNFDSIEGKPTFLWDTVIPGFGIKALPSGTKKFVLKYRADNGGRAARQRWCSIGTYGAITLDQARKQAQQLLSEVYQGNDPQGDLLKKRKQKRLVDVWMQFSQNDLLRLKQSTIQDYQSLWLKRIDPVLGRTPVNEISRKDALMLHHSMRDIPSQGNRVLALLRRLLNLAEALEWKTEGVNPCKYVKKFKENQRDRYLSKEELKSLGKSLDSLVKKNEIWPDIANAVSLLLLTGARRNELLTCELKWIDFTRKFIALPDSKTGKKLIYLSDASLVIINNQISINMDKNSEYLFPGRRKGQHFINLSKSWKRICDHANIEGVRIHDLRHTAASIAVGHGIGLPIVGKLLGHTQAQTTLRYAHVDTDPALSAANLIGDYINDLL